MAFSADTAEFNADVRRAEQVYRDSTSGMSDAAIKLKLAQDRLRRSLAKGPSAFREQARAELAVRNSERAPRRETDLLTAAQTRNATVVGGLRARLSGLSGGFLGLKGGAGALSAGFIGAGGLTYALRGALEAASSLEEQTSKANAIFGESATVVDTFARTTSRAFGIARTDAIATSTAAAPPSAGKRSRRSPRSTTGSSRCRPSAASGRSASSAGEREVRRSEETEDISDDIRALKRLRASRERSSARPGLSGR